MTPPNVCGPSPNACALAQGDFPILAFNKLAESASQGLSLRIPYVEPHPKRNYVMQWNLAIQREIAPNLTATIAYVGSRGVGGELPEFISQWQHIKHPKTAADGCFAVAKWIPSSVGLL